MHASNFDARRIVVARNADIYIADDMNIMELLKAIEGHWLFATMTIEGLCGMGESGALH